MQRWLALSIVPLTGCTLVFGIDADPLPAGHDEDHDGRADIVDNCPGVKNADQQDRDDDEVGDVCDPNPGIKGDTVLHFYPFVDPAELLDWTEFSGNWQLLDDELAYDGPTQAYERFRYTPSTPVPAAVTMEIGFAVIDGGSDQEITILGDFDPANSDNTPHQCTFAYDFLAIKPSDDRRTEAMDPGAGYHANTYETFRYAVLPVTDQPGIVATTCTTPRYMVSDASLFERPIGLAIEGQDVMFRVQYAVFYASPPSNSASR